MNKRSWSIYGSVALVGLIAGAGTAVWTTYPDSVSVRIQRPHVVAHAPFGANRQQPSRQAQAAPKLRLDDSLGTSTLDAHQKKPEKKKETLKEFAAQSARDHSQPASAESTDDSSAASLNLQIPETGGIRGEARAHDFSGVASVTPPTGSKDERKLTFDLDTPDQPAPKVQSYNLFNPEYGLRGFMKQGWISQRVGLQGGLGLNDDRLIQTESGLRDDIAVGMGVILAF